MHSFLLVLINRFNNVKNWRWILLCLLLFLQEFRRLKLFARKNTQVKYKISRSSLESCSFLKLIFHFRMVLLFYRSRTWTSARSVKVRFSRWHGYGTSLTSCDPRAPCDNAANCTQWRARLRPLCSSRKNSSAIRSWGEEKAFIDRLSSLGSRVLLFPSLIPLKAELITDGRAYARKMGRPWNRWFSSVLRILLRWLVTPQWY